MARSAGKGWFGGYSAREPSPARPAVRRLATAAQLQQLALDRAREVEPLADRSGRGEQLIG